MTRYQPGDVVACYSVVKLLEDASAREHRRYLVTANCCGRELERAEETLADYGRRPRERCMHCAHTQSNEVKRAKCAVGERFGPVVVVGPGERRHYWRVRWDCCGKEVELMRRYLVTLRRNARLGQTPPSVCLSCALERARAVVAERRVAPVKVVKVVKVVKPAAVKKSRPVPFVRQEGPIRVRGSARLDEGVMSAAVAWPRPGAAA